MINRISKLYCAFNEYTLSSTGRFCDWDNQKKWLIKNCTKYCPILDKKLLKRALFLYDEIIPTTSKN